jgi:hypothetical protein
MGYHRLVLTVMQGRSLDSVCVGARTFRRSSDLLCGVHRDSHETATRNDLVRVTGITTTDNGESGYSGTAVPGLEIRE